MYLIPKIFGDGKITERAFDKAAKHTRSELLTIAKRYQKVGWDNAIGSSGTIKAARLVLAELGFGGESITIQSMQKLKSI